MTEAAIPTDDLMRLVCEVRRSMATAWAMRAELLSLGADPGYVEWKGAWTSQRSFQVPEAYCRGALARNGLVREGFLCVAIRLRRTQVFVSDTPGASSGGERISALLGLLARRAWSSPDVVFDPCCGTGEVALSVEAPMRLMLDRDPRTLAFADLNRVLNGVPETRTLLGMADLRLGLPRLALAGLSGTALYLAHLPPPGARPPEKAEADALGRSTIDTIAAVRRSMPRTARLRVLLGLDEPSDGACPEQSLLARAAQTFGAERVSWTRLDGSPGSDAFVGAPGFGALAVALD